MSKSKNTEDRPTKTVKVKQYTRMQAERAIAAGEAQPERFIDMTDPFKKGDAKAQGGAVVTANHGNYHVRAKAWRKLGMPIPEEWSAEDKQKFFDSIHYRQPAPMGAAFNGLNPPLDGDNEPIDHPT